VRKFLKGLAWVVGVLGVLVLLARLLLFKVWTIPSDPALAASLAPTLNAGDVVLVLTRGDREAGDLVRCPHPTESGRWIIGRIYASAGDRVKIDRDYVTVNGRTYRTTESCKEDKVHVVGANGAANDLACVRLDFAGGWHFIASGGAEDDSSMQEKVVGPDRLFLVSDNRHDYFDSRDYGDVYANGCTEQIVFRLWGKEGFFDTSTRFEYIR